jgi:hypothetical protein
MGEKRGEGAEKKKKKKKGNIQEKSLERKTVK